MHNNMAVENVDLDWKEALPIGAGLVNTGNTGYANAVLQCLTHTPPLVNYMLTEQHSRGCCNAKFCMMCAIEKHIVKAFRRTGGNFKPVTELRPQYAIGHQQDVFLMHILQELHHSYLLGCALNEQTVDTSLVQNIFEGVRRATTMCMNCGAVSRGFEKYQNIMLDIKDSYNVPQALQRATKPETLDAESGYRCSKCQTIGQGSRKVTFQDVSKVLLITVKRIENSSVKTNKFIRYPEFLNMRPFMCKNTGAPEMYCLYGVVVHSHCNSGHYYSYVKASNREWYKMNNKYVTKCEREEAMKQQACLLFYVKMPKTTPGPSPLNCTVSSSPVSSTSQLRPSGGKRTHRPSSAIEPNSSKRSCVRGPSNRDYQPVNQARKRRAAHDDYNPQLQHCVKRKKLRVTDRVNSSSSETRRCGAALQQSSKRRPVLHLRGDYRMKCSSEVMDDLCDCFSHLRISTPSNNAKNKVETQAMKMKAVEKQKK